MRNSGVRPFVRSPERPFATSLRLTPWKKLLS